jgi:hypothetical protein
MRACPRPHLRGCPGLGPRLQWGIPRTKSNTTPPNKITCRAPTSMAISSMSVRATNPQDTAHDPRQRNIARTRSSLSPWKMQSSTPRHAPTWNTEDLSRINKRSPSGTVPAQMNLAAWPKALVDVLKVPTIYTLFLAWRFHQTKQSRMVALWWMCALKKKKLTA